MIKSLIILVICSFSVSYVFSQVDSSRLFYAENMESAAFVEFGSRIRQVNSTVGMDVDLSVNWLINHKFYVGAAFSQLATVEETYSADTIPPTDIYDIATSIKYQTLGVKVGYILFEDQKIISLSPDLTIGWAGVRLVTGADKQKINGAYLSPAVKAVFNVSDYFRVGLGLNYNLFLFKAYDSVGDASEKYQTQLSTKSLNGFGGGIFLRVGRF